VVTHREGVARGYNRSRGYATGITGKTGAVRGSSICAGFCAGVRWPDDQEFVRRRRVKDENILVILGAL
jgi:hypothetical protein